MAHQRYSTLKHDIYNLEDSLIARAGDVLTPKFVRSIRNKRKHTNLSPKPIFQHKHIRDDLMEFLEEGPYKIIFDSSKVIDQTLKWMGEVMFPPAVFEALDFFKENDFYTYRHILLVSALTTRMASDLIPSPTKLLNEVSVAPMHDFGKITVPLDILKKTSYLTKKEREILEDHTAAGFVLLTYYLGDQDLLSPKVAHEHHERRDGSGYPRGIKLVDKMVELVAVCDIFDALISPRPYRDVPYDTRTALELICDEAASRRLSWDMVRLLISYNRRDKPFYKKCIISKEKRGTPPKRNLYGMVIVENVESGLISVDRDGHIVFLNKAGEDILGYSLDELYKEPVSKIFPWVDLKRERQFRGRAIFKRKDGEDIFLGFSISPSRDIGGKVMVFQDITKVKEKQEQVMRSEKMATIGKLAAGIAHEIRNPIASISGSTEILKEELESSNHRKPLMDIILRESDRLNRLVTDFLQFSKPAQPQKKVFPLKDLIDEALLSLRSNLDWNQDVKVDVQIPNALSVYGDSGQLRQVFLNLFLNALQAMPDGGVLHVSALDRDGLVEVSIQDTGLGIPQGIKEKIFDPFFTTKENGTGLGLTIVHQIIENHQGEIQIKSQKTQGTKVTLSLPYRH